MTFGGAFSPFGRFTPLVDGGFFVAGGNPYGCESSRRIDRANATSVMQPVRSQRLTAKMSWVANLQLLVSYRPPTLWMSRAFEVSVPQSDLLSTRFLMPFFSKMKSQS